MTDERTKLIAELDAKAWASTRHKTRHRSPTPREDHVCYRAARALEVQSPQDGQAAYAAWRADHDPEPQVERLCRETFELGLRCSAPPSGDGRDGWRDIASAPRDGTPVDLWVYNKREPNAAYRAEETLPGWYDVEECFLVVADADGVRPLLWRPLPAPPAPVLGDAEGEGK